MPDQYPKVYLYRRIVQAKLYIDAHYAERIDLDNISGEASFSKFHFIRLFRKIYSRTPHQYLQFVRVEKARQALSEGKSVTDACILAGFESLGSFSGLFKRMTGINPSEFQQKQRELKKDRAARPLHHIPGCFAEKKGWVKNPA